MTDGNIHEEVNTMGYENLPQVIKDSCGFCCWKREMVSGRMTKVPYNPLSGKKVGANRPQDFVDYVTADKYKEGYEGLGIRVSGRIFAFDLDHCIEEGRTMPWAKDIISHFENTYIEKSPSGTGLRIFGIAPDGFEYDKDTYHIKKGNVEAFLKAFEKMPDTLTEFSIDTFNSLVDFATVYGEDDIRFTFKNGQEIKA